ncbi:efflux transporter outer membrane subunit [Sphingomonas montana]|uniref:efflux transporter outer membrane subunit n=1 Tax=Sphingomonas montana TaxID=1843236 RepID=UPI0030B841CB
MVALLIAGCAGPRPAAPPQAAVTAPAGWRTQFAATTAVRADWWRGFGDPVLTGLVETALVNNTDLAVAATRIAEARANQRLARAALSPSLNGSASVAEQRTLTALGTGIDGLVGQPGVQVAYEVDLFGRLATLSRAARADLLAAQASRDTTALSVAATTANGYITLRALDARLQTTRETLVARDEALRLAQRRALTGYTSLLELRQAEAEYQAAAQLVPQVELSISRQENALSVLTGGVPGPIARGRTLAQLMPPAIPSELPSELLRRRPDIAAAEYRLVSADLNLSAARALFLPRLNLAGSAGLALSSLIAAPVTLFSVGGSVLGPIFDGGRVRAGAEGAAARRDAAAFAYRGTALTAFREVDDSLAGVRRSGEQADAVGLQRQALAQALRLATNRYRAGYASYIEQLDAQRGLLTADLTLIQARTDRLTSVVTLYQALGGGWGQ